MNNEFFSYKTVSTDVEADEALEEIRLLNEEKERLLDVAAKRIKNIQEEAALKVEALEKNINSMYGELKAFTLDKNLKHTKTQAKYVLPSGTIVIKKPKRELKADKENLFYWAEENKEEDLIKTVIKKDFDWKKFKADLEVLEDGSILRKSTGEIMDLQGLTVEETRESLEVKF